MPRYVIEVETNVVLSIKELDCIAENVGELILDNIHPYAEHLTVEAKYD